uniref:Uncharacterized protein n=1 Tax=Arundo donax TaxID=35708 RepID=A0A0A8YDL5_ARUDO
MTKIHRIEPRKTPKEAEILTQEFEESLRNGGETGRRRRLLGWTALRPEKD